MNGSNNDVGTSGPTQYEMERVLTWEQHAQLEDFGFSAVDPPEDIGLKEIRQLEDKLMIQENYRGKYNELKKAVLPILLNLKNTADKDHIYWPNRKEKLDKLFQQLGWDPEKPWE